MTTRAIDSRRRLSRCQRYLAVHRALESDRTPVGEDGKQIAPPLTLDPDAPQLMVPKVGDQYVQWLSAVPGDDAEL